MHTNDLDAIGTYLTEQDCAADTIATARLVLEQVGTAVDVIPLTHYFADDGMVVLDYVGDNDGLTIMINGGEVSYAAGADVFTVATDDDSMARLVAYASEVLDG